MTLLTKEHYEVIAAFERALPHLRFTSGRLDKEDKASWAKGNVYQNGEINNLFLAFRHGVAYGTAISRD